MSATSILVRDIEQVFYKMEDSLIEQGNKYILETEFQLGSGVNPTKVDFLVQYTRVLCNDNFDMNKLIESRIKGLAEINCNTKQSFAMELSKFSENYYAYPDTYNSISFLQYIVQMASVNACVSWDKTEW